MLLKKWSLSSLIEAAGEGWIATVEYLLNQGMDPNYMDEVSALKISFNPQ
jgi:hypothetical protein